jgi:glutathione S-transferase
MLGELGLKYDHKDYLPRAPETRTPEFRALNPNGRVPVIDDDGFVLSESMAINLYLSKKYKSPLYPSDPRNEALAWQWSLWETDRLDRQIVNYVRHTTEFPEAERKKEIAEAAWQQSDGIVRCAGGCARESGVACRPCIYSRRSQRRRGALPCVDDRY